ncbi:hypothetical protein GYMLUDRAFT_777589 [Collybiopsis luxurians FD-317 M1]|uniref:Uncharacterized protein n=1 Tax=Collybiopsis luxurians FD-317 M1 TaxID=944289 RepID=A0A0D0B1K7_9AGAR|nr:hypothetical protein GYMLUDRAFT_777589 [Collybiopsis luxurians FD-317 M1]
MPNSLIYTSSFSRMQPLSHSHPFMGSTTTTRSVASFVIVPTITLMYHLLYRLTDSRCQN